MATRRHFLAVAALAVVLVAAAGGRASAQGDDWLRETFEAVRTLQTDAQCFDGRQPRTLHILGLAHSPGIVDEAGRIEILGRLSGLLSQETRLSVTKADTFAFIATSSVDHGPARSREIADLLARADRADITVLVQPFRPRGGSVDAEIRLWGRSAEEDRIGCTPSLVVTIPVADPLCATAFETARARGTVEALASFKALLPACPQVADARTAAALLAADRERACMTAFAEASAANTAPALSGFIAAHRDCALAATAGALLARLTPTAPPAPASLPSAASEATPATRPPATSPATAPATPSAPETAARPETPATAAVPAVHACDRLAARPGSHPALDGVEFVAIDPRPAVSACADAVDAFPGEPRFMTSYGRALHAAERYDEAARWYRRAADAGDTVGMVNLGRGYKTGEGVAQDDGEAVRWFRRAADAGGTLGMSHLGLMYASGRGVERDDAEAVRWYRRAADAGDPSAMHLLGFMYTAGRGVPRDDVRALRWSRRAAAKGHAYAMRLLGWRYENGRGVVKNATRAFGWYERAADAGDVEAMRRVADMYFDGLGVERDRIEAFRWRERAAAEGG